jgi:hypothetical protein
VVVPDADRLHERLDDRRPDEAEPALLQILRERVFVIESPHVAIEGTELFS